MVLASDIHHGSFAFEPKACIVSLLTGLGSEVGSSPSSPGPKYGAAAYCPPFAKEVPNSGT